MKHLFDDAGLTHIYLTNGFVTYEDPVHGSGVGYDDLIALTKQVCVALALRPGRLRGKEFRYLRRAMEIPQSEVARMFGRTVLTVANWEKQNKVPLEASLLMKQNCLRHFEHVGKLAEILDQQGENAFSDLEILMTYDPTKRKWRSNFHPELVVFPHANVRDMLDTLTELAELEQQTISSRTPPMFWSDEPFANIAANESEWSEPIKVRA